MPYDVFNKWVAYFRQRPVDWRHDYRTYVMMKLKGVKEPPEKVFDTLKYIFKPDTPNPDGSISGQNLRASSIFNLLKNAKYGDSPDFLFEDKK